MDCDPRDHDSRDRNGRESHDPRNTFMRDLDLPRGEDRESRQGSGPRLHLEGLGGADALNGRRVPRRAREQVARPFRRTGRSAIR